MFPMNSYTEGKLAKQRMHDHLRDAENDRLVLRAGQASDDNAHSPRSWVRHLSWAGRLLNAILGA